MVSVKCGKQNTQNFGSKWNNFIKLQNLSFHTRAEIESKENVHNWPKVISFSPAAHGPELFPLLYLEQMKGL